MSWRADPQIAERLFGMTIADGREKHICISCQKPIAIDTSSADTYQYYQKGLCPQCTEEFHQANNDLDDESSAHGRPGQSKRSFGKFHQLILDEIAAKLIQKLPEAEGFLKIRLRSFPFIQASGRYQHGLLTTLQPLHAKNLTSFASAPRKLRAARWLYWATLFSEVTYSEFRPFYSGISLEKKLLFPEIKGNCPGACQVHLEPEYAQSSLFGFSRSELDITNNDVGMWKDKVTWLCILANQEPTDVLTKTAENIAESCISYARSHG